MNHPQSLLFTQQPTPGRGELETALIGLLLIGLIVRTILGFAIVSALVILIWKLAKLVDTYTAKLKVKS